MAPSRLVLALVAAGMVLVPLAGTAQDESGLPPETLAQSTPLFAFQSQGNRPALVFTRSGNAQEHDPRVFISSRDSWRLVQLPADLHNTAWVFAGRSITGSGVWGITQGAGTALLFVSSANDGRSWKLRGSLQKVSPQAVVELFSMNEEGKGSLILRLDEDPRPDAPRLGYYLYLTKNGGRNWSEAIYSQGRSLPPPNLLTPPNRTFDGQQSFDVTGWQRLLADLQSPAG
ncbi:MAG TPA: hypothetical protein VGG03_08560 [Thermoanaerobaculia bacterium]